MIKKIFLLVSISLLTACATVSPIATDDAPVSSWSDRSQSLSKLKNWQLNGRMSISANNESDQLNLLWVRNNDHHEINLSGPLNMGMVRLTLDPGKAKLISKNKTYSAKNAEELLAKVIGWRLPVNGLDFWIRGLPAPGIDSEQLLDHRNRMQQLLQSDWEILYQSYTRVGDKELPRIIFIKRIPSVTDTSAELIELRVAISSWAGLKK